MTARPRPRQGADFFDMQAAVGITKHMGGLRATRELLRLCQVQAALRLYLTDPAMRQSIQNQLGVSPEVFRFAGYGLFAGQKAQPGGSGSA
jgi:hypothetical protein